MLLAIDTSTAVASVALFDGQVRAEHTWHSGRQHTTELLPRVRGLLAESGAAVSDLTAVGVALGPGSFNGLRVGLATAKLLAIGLGVPLAGTSTLETTAYQCAGAGELIRPLYDAGRGQVATALYEGRRGRVGAVAEVEPPRLADPAELAASVDRPTLFCGEIKPEWAEAIRRAAPRLAVFVGSAASLRRAGYLAELCWQRIRGGEAADPATLQPLYLRRPPVLEQARV